MPESKQMPEIKRLQGGVILPYNVQQITRTNEDDEQETFYKFDRIKLDQQTLPTLEQVKKHVVEQIRQDLHAHIYPNYDEGSQSTIQSYAMQAQGQGRSDIYNECEKIMNWIDDVLSYYYLIKDNVEAATDEVGTTGVNWDFASDKPAPNDLKSLKEIKAMW